MTCVGPEHCADSVSMSPRRRETTETSRLTRLMMICSRNWTCSAQHVKMLCREASVESAGWNGKPAWSTKRTHEKKKANEGGMTSIMNSQHSTANMRQTTISPQISTV